MATRKAINMVFWFFIIIAIIIIILTVFAYQKPEPPIEPNINLSNINISEDEIIIYYGITCPHCKDLEEWLINNSITSKINTTITQKEVFENKTNNNELMAVAKQCNLNLNIVGVPFVYNNKKCYVGIDEAKIFFNSKIKGVR